MWTASPSLRQPNASDRVDFSDPIVAALVGWWLLNEDTSGAGFSPNLIQPKWIGNAAPTGRRPGPFGGLGKVFNGANPDNVFMSSFPFSAVFSLTAWVRATSVPNAYSSVLSRGAVFEASTNFAFGLRDTGGSPRVFCYTQHGSTLTGAEKLAPASMVGAWHFIAATLDSSLNLTVFLDGLTLGASVITGTPTNGSQALKIGSPNTFTSTDVAFTGAVENARVYSRWLSPGEIMRLYTEPYAGILVYRPRRSSPPSSAIASGALSSTGAVAATGDLVGSGALSSRGMVVGGGDLVAAGALASMGVVASAGGQFATSGAVEGDGAVAASTAMLVGSAALEGDSAVAASGELIAAGAAEGDGAVAGNGSNYGVGVAALEGDSTVTAAGELATSAALEGDSLVTASGELVANGALASAGTVAGTGYDYAVASGALQGNCLVQASAGSPVNNTSGDLASTGVVSAAGDLAGAGALSDGSTVAASARIAATGALEGDSVVVAAGALVASGALAGNSTVTASEGSIDVALGALGGNSTVLGGGDLVAHGALEGDSTIVGTILHDFDYVLGVLEGDSLVTASAVPQVAIDDPYADYWYGTPPAREPFAQDDFSRAPNFAPHQGGPKTFARMSEGSTILLSNRRPRGKE